MRYFASVDEVLFSLKMNTNATASIAAYAANRYHDVCQPFQTAAGSDCEFTKLDITTCAANMPTDAPIPLVISMKSPCADERDLVSVFWST